MESPVKVMKLDPSAIPLTGCQAAKEVEICFDKATEKADMAIYLVYGLSKEEKKSETKWALPKELFPEAVCKKLEEAVQNKAFDGAVGSSMCMCSPDESASKMMCLVGMGSMQEFDLKVSQKMASSVSKVLVENKQVKTCHLIFPHAHCPPADVDTECPYLKAKNMSTESIFQIFMQTLLVELSPDQRFKGKADPSKVPSVKSLYVSGYSRCSKARLEEVVKKARAFAEGMYFTKELVNAPANYCNTITLANAAAEMAKENGLKVKILKQEEIEDLKMGSYLAVSKGSIYPPRFIHLTYTGEGDIKKKFAYVGKGVCFDSGGYNIKSAASSIELMKFDMGGAGACLGAALAISKLKPKNVEVHFIIPAGENMVDRSAYRPGDIITASNGKTIEVGNTDAEGRLMLADALVYADNLNVDVIIDIATLTGACVVALGCDIGGLFSDSDGVAEKILLTAKKAGENMWRMPLESGYKSLMDSALADINNVSSKPKGGAITAALFLKEFVEKTKWAHLDIAGPAWDYSSSTATGYGVKTLTQLALSASECTSEKC